MSFTLLGPRQKSHTSSQGVSLSLPASYSSSAVTAAAFSPNNTQHSAVSSDHNFSCLSTLEPEALALLTQNLDSLIEDATAKQAASSTASAAPPSLPLLSQASERRTKRKQVKNACVNCQKACKKCDDCRPCSRCIKYNLEDTCRDSPRKERKKVTAVNPPPASSVTSRQQAANTAKRQQQPSQKESFTQQQKPTSLSSEQVIDAFREIEASFIQTAAAHRAKIVEPNEECSLFCAFLEACAQEKAQSDAEMAMSRMPTPPSTPFVKNGQNSGISE